MTKYKSDLTIQSVSEFTPVASHGCLPKYTNGKAWVKVDRLGYESLAEVIVSRVIKSLGFKCAEYNPCLFELAGGEIVPACISPTFVRENKEVTDIGTLLEQSLGYRNSNEMYKDFLKSDNLHTRLSFVVDNLAGTINKEYLLTGIATYLYLDMLVLNIDRHLYNMALVGNEHGWDFVYFDFGASLLSEFDDFPMGKPLQTLIYKAQRKAKPFSTKFANQLALLIDYIPTVPNKNVTIDVSDLFDYYNPSHINRCCNVLRQRIKDIDIRR